jgi:hypothetical protein
MRTQLEQLPSPGLLLKRISRSEIALGGNADVEEWHNAVMWMSKGGPNRQEATETLKRDRRSARCEVAHNFCTADLLSRDRDISCSHQQKPEDQI